jgi:hypothetical protein
VAGPLYKVTQPETKSSTGTIIRGFTTTCSFCWPVCATITRSPQSAGRGDDAFRQGAVAGMSFTVLAVSTR